MTETIDVRDMLCAQALAQVSSVMRRVEDGALVEVVCNTIDVRDDLLAWANTQGQELVEPVANSEDIVIHLRKCHGEHR